MNALTALLGLIFICVAALALLPVVSLVLVIALAGGIFFVWLLPILIIAASDKTTTAEKAAWILAIIFLSWFAWIFYFLLAPIKPRDRCYY